MLELDQDRPVVPPRDAATLLLVRDVPDEAGGSTLEVFCVVRHTKSAFLGGAVVFPGGKVDDADRDAAWSARAAGAHGFVEGEEVSVARAFAIAACREALEEAAILLTTGEPLEHDAALALRAEVATGAIPLRAALEARALTLDLAALHPFGRWVTPIAEIRRFDTRFFLAAAPRGQRGAHDAHETTDSFWAAPREVLRRFDAGELQLAPPTHRCLELLAEVSTTEEAILLAARLGKEPICPKLVEVRGAGGAEADTLALVLPGDREHDVREVRVPGALRYVLKDGRWGPG